MPNEPLNPMTTAAIKKEVDRRCEDYEQREATGKLTPDELAKKASIADRMREYDNYDESWEQRFKIPTGRSL